MSGRRHCMFVTISRADSGTLAAGHAVPTLPVENLRDRQLTKVWRSGTTRSWVSVDFGTVHTIDVVAILAHSLTQTATWRVRLSQEAAFTAPLYDTGWRRAWPSVAGFGTLPWGLWRWGDLLAEEEVAAYNVGSYAIPDTAVPARHLRIDIDDPDNPAGSWDIGRLIAGPAWTPSRNIEWGWEIGWRDDSKASVSVGGQTYVDEVPRYRVCRVSFTGLDEGEAYANVADFMDRRKGIGGDVLFIPQPHRPELYVHEVIYGRQVSLPPITHPSPDGRARRFEIQELR